MSSMPACTAAIFQRSQQQLATPSGRVDVHLPPRWAQALPAATFGRLRPCQRRCPAPASAAAAPDGASTRQPVGNPQPLPSTSKEIVEAAFASCQRAHEAGIRRQCLDFSSDLPLVGATDLDDWPGGIRQMFKAAAPMVENLLRQLKQLPGLEGPLQAAVLDSGDAVGSWEGENLALILFPTAETLREVRRLTESRAKLAIIANPQWASEGQVVSPFGIFPWQQKAAQELIAAFQTTFALQSLRINGDSCRWMYTYPHGWQVSVMVGPGESKCILQGQERPSYKEVEAMLRTLPWSMSSKGLMERIQAEADFNRKSLERPPPKGE